MKNHDIMITQTFRNLLIINVISMISMIACVMVDAIVTGQFLGSNAVSAMGLLQPVIMTINLIGSLFGPGLGIVCTRYMGMAKPDRVNQVFSLSIIIQLIVSVLTSFLVFILAQPIALELGGRTGDPEIISMMIDYMRGFSIGLLPMYLSLSLAGLMMLDNDRALGVMSIMTTLITDVVLDFLNVLFTSGGLKGMAIASSLSYFAGCMVILTHFLKKNRTLRFSFKDLHLIDIKEVLINSIPNVVFISSTAIRQLIFNTFLLVIATKTEVAALAVSISALNVIASFYMAVQSATSTLCSLFYGEDDRRAVTSSFVQAVRTSILAFGVSMLIILVSARGITSLFVNTDDLVLLEEAAFFIRFMAIHYFLMSVSCPLIGAYQGTKRLNLNFLLVFLEETVFPILCVIVLGSTFGIKGIEAGFIASGVMILGCCFLIPAVINKRFSVKPEDILILKENMGSKPEDTFEAYVSNPGDITQASEQVMQFCKNKGGDHRTSFMISLFIEEMALNTILYGYQDKKQANVYIRVVFSNDRQIIRFRDMGRPFDPVVWYEKNHPKDPASGLGIRMVISLAKDVRYITAMNLNNLIVTL
ncbi:MAG: ATP-binding protein [Eubacterium sp.]|nr:ATP-binding protein [Eubacterium sp.]